MNIGPVFSRLKNSRLTDGSVCSLQVGCMLNECVSSFFVDNFFLSTKLTSSQTDYEIYLAYNIKL